MRRRDFIAGLSSAAAWPLVAPAQQSKTPVIGFLQPTSSEVSASNSAAFRQGLAETGYVEGSNVAIENRFAEGRLDQLPIQATELVRRQVAVIVARGSDAARAAKNATTIIPIVFNIGNDPVRTGLVASLNRPGGNITGVTIMTREIQGKRLAMTHDLLPNILIIATFSNPASVVSDINLRDLEAAATSIGQRLLVFRTSNDRELEAAFISMTQQGAGALFVNSNPFFINRRDLIVSLAARHRLPTIFSDREPVVAGGLMSYGTNSADLSCQAGIYAARILKGEKPADLPVMQPTKFQFVINFKTAKALGLTIPETLLATADEVIQ